MATPHIAADVGEIAKTVLMPGDPLRAKFIADTYLKDVKRFNTVRNMFGYTGTYHGKPISVMGSGMGMPSIGIYSYELFQFFGVERIVRIGSCGAYTADLNLYDVVLAEYAWSESTFAQTQSGSSEPIHITHPSAELNRELEQIASKLDIPIHKGPIHSSDVFYRTSLDHVQEIHAAEGCLAVEMESFALFHNAKTLGKQAACLLTVSDNLITMEETTSEERQNAFTKMMDIALGLA